MTEVPPPRPGSRSERHQKGRRGRSGRRGTSPAAPPESSPAAPPSPRRAPSATILPTSLQPKPIETGRAARRGWVKDARRGRRRRMTRWVVVLLVLTALAVAGALYLRRENAQDKPTDAPPVRTQRTLLVQVRGAQRTALASALVATDPATSRASLTLLPSRIITEVPGFGDSMLGKGLELGGPDLAAETTANLLGVTVDGTWTVSPEGLAGLVDAIGGVTVDVDVEVRTAGAGATTIEAGTHQLTGREAATFATYQGPEERELAKLPRLQAVLMAMVKAMPPTAATLLPGAGSESSLDPGPLADQLRLLAAADSTSAVSYAVLPVSELEFGGDEVTYKLETAQVQALIDSNLAASVPESAFGRNNRVLVQNGVGTAAISRTVTKKLLPAGFRVVGSGNADNFDYRKSVVLIFDDSPESVAVGERVAEVLRLPSDAVQISTVAQTTTDVIVIVGADYKP